jgi:hypothetical protein
MHTEQVRYIIDVHNKQEREILPVRLLTGNDLIEQFRMQPERISAGCYGWSGKPRLPERSAPGKPPCNMLEMQLTEVPAVLREQRTGLRLKHCSGGLKDN